MTVLGGVDGGGGGGGAGTRAQAKTLELLCNCCVSDMVVETADKLNEEVHCYPYIKDMDHHARWIGRFART